jgi:uncharacterized protein YerC
MTDLRDYIAYFQQLANEHVDINDFFIMDINEPVMAFKNGMKFPALILNSVTGVFDAPNLDNKLDRISGGFLVIDNVPEVDDFFNEMITLQQMKQLGSDIIARMLYDKLKCETLAVKAIPGFDIRTVSYEMMGPLFDNCFGFNFTFKLITTVNLDYDPEKWDPAKSIEGKSLY